MTVNKTNLCVSVLTLAVCCFSPRSAMMREQMQCLGRMLVRSSNDVPLCENVEWMWAQCRSCCCTWITKNLRTPRVRGSSLKKTAGMQQQQQLIQQQLQLQQQLPQTPISRNQWRQPKERLDSEDSSGNNLKIRSSTCIWLIIFQI